MDAIYLMRTASAREVMDRIPDPPSYSSVRKLLHILEKKGFVRHVREGVRYVYAPTIPHEKAVSSAISRLVATYFNNSVTEAMAALIEHPASDVSDADLDRMIDLIETRKRGG